MDLYIKLEVYKGGQKEESHAEHWQNCIICVCIIYIFVFILFFFFFLAVMGTECRAFHVLVTHSTT
jgi:hypothetical protein